MYVFLFYNKMYALKGKMLKTQRGRLVKAEKVISESSVVALFYSASWSKYCKEFIPILKDIYAVYSYIDSSTDDIEKNDICPQENVKLDYNIAVINVPFDESKVAMEDHFRTQGDWYTIQYGDIAAVYDYYK